MEPSSLKLSKKKNGANRAGALGCQAYDTTPQEAAHTVVADLFEQLSRGGVGVCLCIDSAQSPAIVLGHDGGYLEALVHPASLSSLGLKGKKCQSASVQKQVEPDTVSKS